MRGTAEWNHSYTLEMGPERFTLVRAEAFNPEEVLGQAFEEKDGMYRIQFTPGVLEAS
jgi:hypothetical protein